MIAIVPIDSPKIILGEKKYINNCHCAVISLKKCFGWSAAPTVKQRGVIRI